MNKYNLCVDRSELACIISGLKREKESIGDGLDFDIAQTISSAIQKAEALLAWVEADIAASQARGHYKNILQYGIDGLPFD